MQGDEDVEPSIEHIEQDFDVPLVDDADDADDSGIAQPVDDDAEMNGATGDLDATLMAATAESALARMRGQKRDRASLQGADQTEQLDSSVVMTDAMPLPQKRKRGRPRKSDTLLETAAEGENIDQSQLATGDQSVLDNGGGPSTLNLNQDIEAATDAPVAKRRGRPPKSSQPKSSEKPKSSSKMPKSSQQSPSKSGAQGASVGPVSNVHLRATTPFEDSHNHASRYGRNLIKPLKYWQNESRIYRNGNIEGIVRAEEAELVKTRARKPHKRGGKPKQRLEVIEEVSDTESIAPDEWEGERGVLSFDLANYDPATGLGDIDDAIRQGMFPIGKMKGGTSVHAPIPFSNADQFSSLPLTDIAFSESAISPRDVPGSDFRYAKILTLPFFGAGLVEVPPGGFKRAKNSRRMQLTFFVHEGKVAVDMSAGEGCEVNSFAISKGGVWVVPRGEFYRFLFSSMRIPCALPAMPAASGIIIIACGVILGAREGKTTTKPVWLNSWEPAGHCRHMHVPQEPTRKAGPFGIVCCTGSSLERPCSCRSLFRPARRSRLPRKRRR
jgi:centromere protein C